MTDPVNARIASIMHMHAVASIDRRKSMAAKARSLKRTPSRGAEAQKAKDEIAEYLARNPTPAAKW